MSASLVSTLILLQAVASVSPAPPSPPAAPGAVASAAAATPVSDPAPEEPADPVVCRRDPDPSQRFAPKQCHRMSVWNRMARADN